jgi:macrolide transport system ATP-binding/permease protein
VVLGHAFWEAALGGDEGIVGRTLSINRVPFTVIGVAPAGFTGTLLGGGPSVWVPMSMHDVVQPNFDWYDTRRGLFLFAFGRLRDGVTLEQAGANLSTIFSQLEQAFPDDNRGRSAGAVPLLDARLNPNGQAGAPVVRISILLMTVVGIVLLIACANIANLLLARATKRRREIAVRLALGAQRRRLLRQLLTESVLLSTLGAAAGVLLAYWLLDILRATALPLPVPVDDNSVINARVLLFTGGLAIVTGLLFGIAPALQASGADVLATLKNELVPAGGGRRGGGPRLRQLLVVAQVAASLVALVAAAMFLRGLREAQAIDPGFETEGVLIANVNLGREGYTPERGQIYYQQAVERLRGLPGVQHAAVAQNAPFAGGFLRSIFLEGADTTSRDRVLVQVNSVSPGYLETIGVPLVGGRDFTSADAEGSMPVVIVNEQMAQQFWPGEDALGKRFRFFGDEDFTTVVGVAKTAKYNGVAEEPIPFIYQPLMQNYTPAGTVHVRTAGPAAPLAPSVRAALREVDPTLALFNIQTLEDQVADALAPLRTNVILLTAFGGLALLLAAIGLYGVTSYTVTHRTREIGVRMALGARPGAVLGLVLTQGLALVGIGLAIGLVAALGLSALVPPDLVANTSPRDPVTLAMTAALLAFIAAVATYLPARRATRIDPLIALRTE